jgi:UDP-N-acetylglucosamine--N-acetylmuramyl-(pentapeptide) pyrophosphoryl-undecaprenol N-acetylglucosamine transferase
VIVTGGGTGGHLYPAISIAQALREGYGADVHFVGSRDGLEAQIIPREGFPFHALPSRKLSRGRKLASASALVVLGWGALRAVMLLRELRPDVVVGTGGYVSAGVVLAACVLRIPSLIHEQNAVAGRTNRLLGRFCRRVAITFEESAACFPGDRSTCTGLPIRPEFATANPDPARRLFGLDPVRPTLLVVGGSGGARRLNEIVTQALPGILERGVQVVHQLGKGNVGEWASGRVGDGATEQNGISRPVALSPPRPVGYHPVAYIDDMASALAAADVVLCRAGASTLAEVTTVGVPSLLVPYPYAVDDHQTKNARVLAERGVARLLPESELSPERLLAELDALLRDPEARNGMRQASARLSSSDAARRVADLVRDLTVSPQRRNGANHEATKQAQTRSEQRS